MVGVRLLLLARRTHEWPELQIGFAFSTIGLLGYPLMVASGLGVSVLGVMTCRVLSMSEPAQPSIDALGPWMSAMRLPFGIWYGWTAFESLRCWQQGRRRRALGLSDPVVVNRFLLWGTMGVLESFANLGGLAIELQGANMFQSLAGALFMGANGVIASSLMFLTFMPPQAYLRFVEARAARSER